MKWLEGDLTEERRRPMSMVLYGPPGIGKTSFGAAIPGALFLIDAKEEGVNTLKASRLIDADVPVIPTVASWQDVMEVLTEIVDSTPNYRCLVVDTVGGLERLCHQHVCTTKFGGDWGEAGFSAFQRGYEISLPFWRTFLERLDDLRARGMSICLLGHSIIRPYGNPTGDGYDRFVPSLHKKTWDETHRWADMVLFANYLVHVDKTKKGGAKGVGGKSRTMFTEYDAAYEAKNRSGLPDKISMGTSGKEAWQNLSQAIQESKGDLTWRRRRTRRTQFASCCPASPM